MTHLVVVGASLAGLRAVEAVRGDGFDGAVTLVGAEEHLPYDRPPLSKEYLASEEHPEPTYREQSTFADDLDVELVLGTPASAVDTAARTVTVGERALSYDALVIATGAHARTLPGTEDLDGVFTIRTLDDSRALRAALRDGTRRVTVVGAGFIGSEVASVARGLGLEVTILEALETPLVRAVGERMGRALTHRHERHGTEVRTGVAVEEVVADEGRVRAVRLADGSTVDTGVLVVGIGARPATDWLEGSGLAIDDGVVADATLAAAAGVYVAGDIARWPNALFDDVLDGLMRLEHWTSAAEQGARGAQRRRPGVRAALRDRPVLLVGLVRRPRPVRRCRRGRAHRGRRGRRDPRRAVHRALPRERPDRRRPGGGHARRGHEVPPPDRAAGELGRGPRARRAAPAEGRREAERSGSMTTTEKPDVDPVDLSSLEFWGRPMAEREASFGELRRERPVSWHRAPEGMLTPGEDGPGFWAVVRHEDIVHVSKNPKLFCSGQGVQFQDVPEELLEATQSFLAMDAPRHTKLRKIVSSAFTPKQVRRISDRIAQRAATIIDDLVDHGDGDFVQLVAKRLPMGTIYDLMGAPPEYQGSLAEAADLLVATNDPDVLENLGISDPLAAAGQALHALLGPALELAEARRREPRDDLMTNLVQAEVDGDSLTDNEIGAFFVLLSVAGNDTTRNTIAHTMRRLTEHPDQRAWLREDPQGRIATAVEEFVRHASPVLTFRRTATQDTELRGQPIAAGDKVVMFYESGNRDAEVFSDPLRFDLARDPNPHVGFGGGGPHFCLGNMLARTQLQQIFSRLLTRVPDLTVGEPELLRSNFVHGVKTMPCSITG